MSEAPRRLHPATLALELLRGAPSTLLGLPAALSILSDLDWAWVLAAAIVATAIAGAVKYVAWRRFTYTLTDDAVVIESGLLSRNRRIIPFERIQDVDIERRLLARLFGLAKVTLETGGSDEDEGDLDSVSLAEAQRLRETVRRRASGAEAGAAIVAENALLPDPPVSFAMPLSRVLLSGLFNFSLVWLAVIGAFLQYAEDWYGIDWTGRAFWTALEERADAAIGLPILAWVVVVLAVAALGVVAGLVRTLLRDYGFAVHDEGARLRRVRGLLTHSETVVALRRVQLAMIDTGPVRRALGWQRLRVQTLGGEGEARNPELAPFARAGEVDALLVPLKLDRPDPAGMTRVSSGHVVRALVRQLGLPAIAILIAALFATPALFALPLLVPMAVAALLRRRHHRYALPDRTLFVQRGVLARTTWMVPVANAQVVTIRQGWLQRVLGVATVEVDTAGGARFGGPAVQDVALGQAWTLAALLRERRHPRPAG